MSSFFTRLYWWLAHLGYAHYAPDLGRTVRVEPLPLGGTVAMRECAKCGRIFSDFQHTARHQWEIPE